MVSPITKPAAFAFSTGNSIQTSDNAVSSNASFAQMLTAACQSSGASGENSASSSSQQIINDFEKWKLTTFPNSTSGEQRAEIDKYSATFEQIIKKAAAQGGYSDPQGFLKTLSSPELEALQHIHSLADPITPDSLTKEGALNLLYSPDQAKDIDHDGFEMVGKAKQWQFPPVDAPESVKKAWTTATANMSPNSVLMLESSFMPVVTPGTDASAASTYLGPDADYVGLVKKALEGALFSSKYDQSWQKENRAEEISGLERFLDNLEQVS